MSEQWDALRKLEEDATPGPWKAGDFILDYCGDANSALIIAARNAIPELLRQIEAMEGFISEYEWLLSHEPPDDLGAYTQHKRQEWTKRRDALRAAQQEAGR